MKNLLVIVCMMLLSGCQTAKYNLCIPMGNGQYAQQIIETPREVEEVEITYNPETNLLHVRLIGVTADPIAKGVADMLKRAEISPGPAL